MNEQIRELVKQSGGEFWQRIESDGVLNNEAYITFDPPQLLEKFAELIVAECLKTCTDVENEALQNQEYKAGSAATLIKVLIKQHFGVEE